MCPDFSQNNYVDRLEGNSKLLGKHSLSNASVAVQSPDFQNFLFREFVNRVALAFSRRWIFPSSFLDRVLNVVVSGSKEQVSWIAARRIVTSMKHIQTLVKWAISQQVGHSMGVCVGPHEIKNTVGKCASFCSLPWPTIVESLAKHFIPKPFFQFCWGSEFVYPSCMSLFTSGVISGNLFHRSVFAESGLLALLGLFIVPNTPA